jgi:hypothetical protein
MEWIRLSLIKELFLDSSGAGEENCEDLRRDIRYACRDCIRGPPEDGFSVLPLRRIAQQWLKDRNDVLMAIGMGTEGHVPLQDTGSVLLCTRIRFKRPPSRSQWPRGLRHELFSPAPTLRSWVRIPLRHGCLCVLCAFFLCLHSLR